MCVVGDAAQCISLHVSDLIDSRLKTSRLGTFLGSLLVQRLASRDSLECEQPRFEAAFRASTGHAHGNPEIAQVRYAALDRCLALAVPIRVSNERENLDSLGLGPERGSADILVLRIPDRSATDTELRNAPPADPPLDMNVGLELAEQGNDDAVVWFAVAGMCRSRAQLISSLACNDDRDHGSVPVAAETSTDSSASISPSAYAIQSSPGEYTLERRAKSFVSVSGVTFVP